ncbi:Uncharacterised protein [Segatella copri]|nr:Uncharacterised protein [Segatella copri]
MYQFVELNLCLSRCSSYKSHQHSECQYDSFHLHILSSFLYFLFNLFLIFI